ARPADRTSRRRDGRVRHPRPGARARRRPRRPHPGRGRGAPGRPRDRGGRHRGAAVTPTGTGIRRLTRLATRAHGGGSSSDLFGDVYIIALNIAVALGMGLGLLNYLNATARSHDAAPGMNPLWFALSLGVALLGATIGLAARLGPVNLSGGQA